MAVIDPSIHTARLTKNKSIITKLFALKEPAVSEPAPTTTIANKPVQAVPLNELSTRGTRAGLFVQTKLHVGSPDDPFEKEADSVADKVMRMPEQNFVQRKCAECEREEEKHGGEEIQRKPESRIFKKAEEGNGGNGSNMMGKYTAQGTVSEESAGQLFASKGSGDPLPKNTKSEMERGFGVNFSNVRIHTDSQATNLSKNLKAQAFTHGSDIYFNSGKFDTQSQEGKRLLAHELTHVVQQGKSGSGSVVRLTPETCPPRPADERASSERPEGILPVNIVTTSDSIIVQDFAVNSHTIPRNVTNSMDWQRLMSDIAGNPSIRGAIQGHTDCVGSDSENISLREQRVQAVTSAMPAAARSKIIFSFSTDEVFLDTNLTAEGRAKNRAVKIIFREMDDEVHACDQLTRASNTDELIFLVRCAEERLGLSSGADARLFISALRQIYYGNAEWTIEGNRNRVWNDVIDQRPWSPSDNPADRLGENLFNALRRSQVVNNTDFGHLLTGLDAMFNPHNVVLDFGRATFETGLINEEWATWAGDVGSAAATWAEQSLYAQSDAEIDPIFIRLASSADLRGNIDSFAIRQGMLGIADPALALAAPLRANTRLSEILQNYYRITGSTLGRRRGSRISDFVRAYGGVVSGNSIANKDDLAVELLPSIQEFAFMFFMQNILRRGYFADDHAPPNANVYLARGVDLMTIRFVEWLESNL